MKTAEDLVGMTFSRLTVISFEGSAKGHKVWNCICSCGNEKLVRGSALKSESVKSCGCLHKESAASQGKKMFKHGHATTTNKLRTRTYGTWYSMKDRCYNKNNIQFSDWGGRGISVCEEWFDFTKFLSDMGERPEGTTIDRVDVNKNYCKENCKWSTYKEQANNKRIGSNEPN